MAVLFRPFNGITFWCNWCSIEYNFITQFVQTRRRTQSSRILFATGLGFTPMFGIDFTCCCRLSDTELSACSNVIYVPRSIGARCTHDSIRIDGISSRLARDDDDKNLCSWLLCTEKCQNSRKNCDFIAILYTNFQFTVRMAW